MPLLRDDDDSGMKGRGKRRTLYIRSVSELRLSVATQNLMIETFRKPLRLLFVASLSADDGLERNLVKIESNSLVDLGQSLQKFHVTPIVLVDLFEQALGESESVTESLGSGHVCAVKYARMSIPAMIPTSFCEARAKAYRFDLSNAGSLLITFDTAWRISVSREPSLSNLLILAGANESADRAAWRSVVEREVVDIPRDDVKRRRKRRWKLSF